MTHSNLIAVMSAHRLPQGSTGISPLSKLGLHREPQPMARLMKQFRKRQSNARLTSGLRKDEFPDLCSIFVKPPPQDLAKKPFAKPINSTERELAVLRT